MRWSEAWAAFKAQFWRTRSNALPEADRDARRVWTPDAELRERQKASRQQ